MRLYWYDGEWRMPHPQQLEANRKVPGTGAILLGEAGGIMHGSHGASGARVIPDSKMRQYKQPEQKIPRVKGHHWDWLDAIRKGRQAGSDFDYGGQLTELALLGVIAIKFLGRKLRWDAAKVRFPNCPEANQYVNPPYRGGWAL